MKHKIVVKVQISCGKCRTKAMKIAAVESGVSSVQIEGENKDHVVVVGDEVDSVSLTRSLRKKVGYATLLSVEQVKETKTEPEATKVEEDNAAAASISSFHTIQHPEAPIVCCHVVHDQTPDNCSIL
ncbi:Heavy metal-associated domain containing protein [Parasponia andersonii]|uniref:Heavy metal-associated domain containing protein n=1 Tax=Parasponia andersonii TaxID=3476 RepID=A0A2P5BVU2_PARAD|nr:Heavy metal-associated domain containing protein [Parasponia andersonii]